MPVLHGLESHSNFLSRRNVLIRSWWQRQYDYKWNCKHALSTNDVIGHYLSSLWVKDVRSIVFVPLYPSNRCIYISFIVLVFYTQYAINLLNDWLVEIVNITRKCLFSVFLNFLDKISMINTVQRNLTFILFALTFSCLSSYHKYALQWRAYTYS